MVKPSGALKAKQRGSSSFSLETHLVDALRRQLRKLLEETPYGDQFKVFTGVPVGAIIPDLMVVRLPFGSRVISNRKCQVPWLDGFVLSTLLNSESLSENEIADRLFLRQTLVGPSLRRLKRANLVVQDVGGFRLGLGQFPLDAQIVAIEAKLTRWKDAIEQAVAYLDFANQSYVALPDDVVKSIPRISKRCEDAGVGLISVGNGSVCIEKQAKFRAIYTPGWSWVMLRAVL